MAVQKITARVSLSSGSLDPANDVLGIVDVSAGSAGSKKITVNALFSGWGMTTVGAALAKALTVQDQKEILGFNIHYSSLITGLTGGGPTKVDGIPTVGSADNRIVIARSGSDIFIYRGATGTYIEDVPRTINADDQTEGYSWILMSFQAHSNTTGLLRLSREDSDFSTIVGSNIDLTSNRLISFPDNDGTLNIQMGTSFSEPTTGQTTSMFPKSDWYYLIAPAGTIAAHTFEFPPASDSLDGQIIIIKSTQIVTSVTLVPGVDTVIQPQLTAMASEVSYRFVFVQSIGCWSKL